MSTRDGHIRLLPLHVANKIAAGEVVERPASVLKELLENAIDAGATRIDAVVTAGGRKLVSVRDDGCGMAREDALLSLERQATSKIRDVDDIERIDTLGFRGEAIPSIASVSRFSLTTRRAGDEGGTRLTVNAGTLAEVRDCGAPPGTCVEVRDLFCNVPARRKFLRAFATEEGHVRATFTVHALAHPDIGFSLALDGRETYRLAPGASLEERIHDLFGAAFSEALVPVDGTTGAVHVHGYVERPGHAAGLRKDQFVFINGRPATAAAIAAAIREAYPRARDESRPALILFIDLPADQVDVNVHPAKREVRFRRASDVREAILGAFAQSLRRDAPEPVCAPPDGPAARNEPAVFLAPFTSAPVQPAFQLPTPPQPPRSAPTGPSAAHVAEPAAQTGPDDPGTRAPATPLWRCFNYLAQTDSGYLLLETDAGLVTLDPRAARERIVYERLIDRHQAVSQPLLLPETVKLPPADSARIRNFLAELTALGFMLEEFGRDTWKLDAVPDLAAGIPTADLLATIAADIAEAGARRGGTRWRDEIVAKSVARSFAGASTRLTREGAVQLVEELAAARMPYVCPRGKPVMVFTSNRELSRKFGK
ncbi:MAG: DNA mismatch repair endonuclease MutL [Kiritimatiellia bacterium]